MAETALPNMPEISGEADRRSEKIYTREEVIKAHRDGLTLMAAAAGRNELRQDQMADFDISTYGFKNAYKDKFEKPKRGRDYGKVDVTVNGDLENERQYTYKEGPAVEGIINFLGEQIVKTDDPEEQNRLREIQKTLLDNSRLHNLIHINESFDHKVGRVHAESYFISQDERRTRGNQTDNYYAAEAALQRRRELVLPSATKNKTIAASTNGVTGIMPPSPIRADNTIVSPAFTGGEYSPPAPVREALAREATAVVKPPAPDAPIPEIKKITDAELPPSPVEKTAGIKLTADEVAPFKTEKTDDEDDLPPAVSSVGDIQNEKKVVFGIGNAQRNFESQARKRAIEAVNEQLRAGNFLRRTWTRLREVYLTEKYTQRLMDAMKQHDNVNVDFDPIKNALRSVQSGDYQRDEARDEAKAALEHAASGETIEGETVIRLSKEDNPKLHEALLNDIIKPAYDGSIKDEKELRVRIADFIKKNTDATADPDVRDTLLKVFGSDERQLAKVSEFFATDILDKVNEIKDANNALADIDEQIVFELSNVRWGAETQANYKWHDKIMNWTKKNNVGGVFLNPLVAGAVTSLGLASVMAARGALRKGANLVAPVIGGAAVGALFSAFRRNTELKTDRATYLEERALGGEKKTTADNRNEVLKLLHADTMKDLGNFEYNMVDAKDLSYGGGTRLLDDEGNYIVDPAKRNERLSLETLISTGDQAGIIDRIAEIRARRNFGAKNGVDLIRVDDNNRVQRDRNLQLDNTLKMLRQELSSQGMTEEQIKEATGEAEKKWSAAFDVDVQRQDKEFDVYKTKRVAVGAATSFATGLAGAGIFAAGRGIIQETGAGQAVASAIGRGANAIRENARNLNVPDILQNSAFNALGPLNGPALRVGLDAMDQARDQVVDGVRANLPGIGHGLQVMFDEAPALNAIGELGENAMNAARADLADAGMQFDRFGNAIGENVRGIRAGLDVMAEKAPAVGAVREFFDNLFGADAVADGADAAGDVADNISGQVNADTDFLQQSREIGFNPHAERLDHLFDAHQSGIVALGDPGADQIEMHVANREIRFYDTNGHRLTEAIGKLGPDGHISISGEIPSDVKEILKDEGFSVIPGAVETDVLLEKSEGTVVRMLGGNETRIPEGTRWIDQGSGSWDLVADEDPSKVLLNNAHFDANGQMVWEENGSMIPNNGDFVHTETIENVEPGRSTVNIIDRKGIWASDNVRNMDSVWFTNTEPDAVGNSDLNERSLWLRTDGNGVTLETHLTQDVSFIDANDNDLIDPTDAQINVQNAINENRVGFAFSLPGSENQAIVVQAVNGNLSLRPDSSELVRIWDGTGFNKTMPASELYNALINPEAVARMPGGYVAGGQDLFKLGVNQDGVIRNGLVRIVVPENNTLNTIATIQSHGAADVVAEVVPGTPSADVDRFTKIDLPDDITTTTPTYDVTPLERSVPIDPILRTNIPETPGGETFIPTVMTPEKPEYTTYIPTIATPGATADRYSFLADAVIPTNITPRDPLDPRGGKPGKEKKPGETPEPLSEKGPQESEVPGTEKAPKEKAADASNLESTATNTFETDKSKLRVGEISVAGRAGQDRVTNLELGQGRFIGLYDGHGSDRAAQYASENLHNVFILGLADDTPKQEALRLAMLKTGNEIKDQEKFDHKMGGATASVAFIEGDKIYYANVGDAVGYLLKADGTSVALSKEHKGLDPDEKSRIEAAGGLVRDDGAVLNKDGEGLMVSRALGDKDWEGIVSGDPHIAVETITPEVQWGILASDGFNDAIKKEEIPGKIRDILAAHPEYTSEQISKELVNQAIAVWEKWKSDDPVNFPGQDDISLQLVDLREYIKKK